MSPAEGGRRDPRDSTRSPDAFADAAEGVPALDLPLSDAALGVLRRF